MHNKIKAFLIHLSLSVVVVSLAVSLMIYFWFPLDYLGITNFKEISLLIISIDIVIGPILTFVVYNPNKRSLNFDLSVIALLQISALVYGIYTLYLAHPVYITYAKGSFTLVNANLAKPKNSKFDEYNVSKLNSVVLAYAGFPRSVEGRNKLLDESFAGGPDLEERTDLYLPYDENIEDILRTTLDKKMLFEDVKVKKKLKNFVDNYNIEEFAYLPLEGSSDDAIIVLDKITAKPITTLKINPWEYVKK